MMNDASQPIRNVALVSAPGSGKTILSEALAFTAKAIDSMGLHRQRKHHF